MQFRCTNYPYLGLCITNILSVYPSSLWLNAAVAPQFNTSSIPSWVPAVPRTFIPCALAICTQAIPTWKKCINHIVLEQFINLICQILKLLIILTHLAYHNEAFKTV